MRRLVLAFGIVLAAAAWAAVDPNSGVRTWWELRGQLREAEARAAGLRAETSKLESAAERLQRDPLALEAAIRGDLGLARPGETIVRAVAPSNP
jgi:cell division protein FtsB